MRKLAIGIAVLEETPAVAGNVLPLGSFEKLVVKTVCCSGLGSGE